MNEDYFTCHLTDVAKPSQNIQQISDKDTSEIINFGNLDVRNKLAIMSAVKHMHLGRANGMEWFDEQWGMDSISHSSSDLGIQSYFEEKWNTVPSNQFEGEKREKNRKSTDERFLRHFGEHCERHSDVYSVDPKTSRVSPINKPAWYQRQKLSKKSALPFLQPETADTSYTNNPSFPREPRELEQLWGSPLCSNPQAANLSANSSFDKLRWYKNLSVLEPQTDSPSQPWDFDKFSPMYSNSEGRSTSAYRSRRMIMGCRDQVIPLSQQSVEELMLRNERFWQFHELYNQFRNFENNSVEEETCMRQRQFSTIPRGEPHSHSVPKPEYRKRKELTPRPSPKNPKTYKAISRVLVRAGRSLKSPQVTYLKEGSIVIVNQLKKRRARIVQPNKTGEYERVGWVSTHSGDNERMLVPWNNGSPSVE